MHWRASVWVFIGCTPSDALFKDVVQKAPLSLKGVQKRMVRTVCKSLSEHTRVLYGGGLGESLVEVKVLPRVIPTKGLRSRVERQHGEAVYCRNSNARSVKAEARQEKVARFAHC